MPQFALAWLLHNDAVTRVIGGPRLPEHLDESVKVDDVELDDEVVEAADEINPPSQPYGEWW